MIDYSKRLAKALIRLRVCAGGSKHLLVQVHIIGNLMSRLISQSTCICKQSPAKTRKVIHSNNVTLH